MNNNERSWRKTDHNRLGRGSPANWWYLISRANFFGKNVALLVLYQVSSVHRLIHAFVCGVPSFFKSTKMRNIQCGVLFINLQWLFPVKIICQFVMLRIQNSTAIILTQKLFYNDNFVLTTSMRTKMFD